MMQDRLYKIHNELTSIIEKYKPEYMVSEMLFFGINSRTAIMVGQARGVIMLAASQNRLPFQDYTGLQVKLMVAGAGRADKNAWAKRCRLYLDCERVPSHKNEGRGFHASFTRSASGNQR